MSEPPEPSPSSPRRRTAGIGLAALAVLAFASSLAAGFVYDDVALIVENARVNEPGGVAAAFRTHLWDTGARPSVVHQFYRPLVVASYVIDWRLGSGAPWTFHAFNVAAHAAAVAVAFRVVQRWVSSRALAVAVIALFALHPSRAEAVAWISGRADVLAALFTLVSVELWHRASEHPGRGVVWWGGGAVAAVAALLCKETAVFLFAPVLADAWCRDDGARRRRLLRASAVAAGIGVVYVLVRAKWLPVSAGGGWSLTPTVGLSSTAIYVARLMWPWPLTFFPEPTVFVDGRPAPPTMLVVGGAVAWIGFLAGVVRLARGGDRTGAVLLVAAMAHVALLAGFVDTGARTTVSDRYTYFPLLLLGATVARRWPDPWRSRVSTPRAAMVGGAVLMVFAGVDATRALDLRSNDSLWARELTVEPDNPFVLREVAKALARRGDLSSARERLRASLGASSVRFGALAPPPANVEAYARLLALTAAQTADGDTPALRRLLVRLERLGAPGASRIVWNDAGIEISVAPSAVRSYLDRRAPEHAVEVALLATRLADVRKARTFLTAIGSTDLGRLPNPLNVVLAHARIRDYRVAWARLQRVHALHGAGRVEVTLEEIFTMRDRLERSERAWIESRRLTTPARQMALATASIELGAHQQAIDVLRPVHRARPGDERVLQALVEVLVRARLENEAKRLLMATKSEAESAEAVAAIARQLPPRIAAMAPVVGPPIPRSGAQNSLGNPHAPPRRP